MFFKFGFVLLGLAVATIEKSNKFRNERKRVQMEKFSQKLKNFWSHQNFGQKSNSEFWSIIEIEILVKNRNQNFGQKSI